MKKVYIFLIGIFFTLIIGFILLQDSFFERLKPKTSYFISNFWNLIILLPESLNKIVGGIENKTNFLIMLIALALFVFSLFIFYVLITTQKKQGKQLNEIHGQLLERKSIITTQKENSVEIQLNDIINSISEGIHKRIIPGHLKDESSDENTNNSIKILTSFINNCEKRQQVISKFHDIWGEWTKNNDFPKMGYEFINENHDFEDLRFLQEIVAFLLKINQLSDIINTYDPEEKLSFANDIQMLPDEIKKSFKSMIEKEKTLIKVKANLISILNKILKLDIDITKDNNIFNKKLKELSLNNFKIISYEHFRDELMETINALKKIYSVPALISDANTISDFLNDIYETFDELKNEDIHSEKIFAAKYIPIITKIRNILLLIKDYQLKTNPEFVYLLFKANRIIENMSDLFDIQFDTLPFRVYDLDNDQEYAISYNSQESYKNMLKFKLYSILAFLEYEKNVPVDKDEFEIFLSENKTNRQSFLNRKVDDFLKINPDVELCSILEIAELGYRINHQHLINKSKVILNKKG